MRTLDRFPRAALVALVLLAPVAHAIAQTAPPAPPPPKSYLLQVALLVGDRQGPTSLDELPANTRKAVQDVREFLPFQSYRLVDVAVLRSSGEGHARINGPGGEDYEVAFSFDRVLDDSQELRVRHFAVRDRTPLPELADVEATSAEAAAAYAKARQQASRSLIGTSFSVEVGETIVVGTSKLNGDGRALIVLLTAIP